MGITDIAISNYSLTDLGFSSHFLSQLSLEELEALIPVRITEVQRDRLTAIGENGEVNIVLTVANLSGDIAVGDWMLIDSDYRPVRILSPKSSLLRRAAGTDATAQLIANNVDTLFVVTSCNADGIDAVFDVFVG